jgi:hypothetical protein
LQIAISEYQQGIDQEEIEAGIRTRMLELSEEATEKEEAEDFTVDMPEPTKTVRDNSSNVRLLTNAEDNDVLSTSSFRKRTISTAKENKSASSETHELVDLSNQEEQLETQIQIPTK